MGTELNALKQRLIMSVGTHRRSRPLSPTEVAEGLRILEADGMSGSDIAGMLQLEGTSMLGRFARLRKLSPRVGHLVDWRGSSSSISFSTASEIARLPGPEQEELTHTALQKSMTKNEVVQVVQLRQRARGPVSECIEQVLRMRPRVVYREIFVGAIRDEAARARLEQLTQAERNSLLQRALASSLRSVAPWAGRLGQRFFTIVGGERLARVLNAMEPDFEAEINRLMSVEASR